MNLAYNISTNKLNLKYNEIIFKIEIFFNQMLYSHLFSKKTYYKQIINV